MAYKMAAIFHFYHNSTARKIRTIYKNTHDTNMTEIFKKILNTVIYLSFTVVISITKKETHQEMR